MPKRFLVAALVLLFAASPYFGIPAWTPALATVVAFLAISLIGLNLIFGVTGMLALGQAAFAAIPGYAAGIIEKAGASSFLSIPVGLVIAVVVARLVAEIFIRLPGIYFAIGTLGFAFVVEGLARAFPSLTGGASGLVLVSPVTLGPGGWYALAASGLVIALLAYVNMATGEFLRTLKLIRHDELAAEVLGINVARVKCRIFTIGCAYSAVGGLLLAYFTGVLVPESGGVNHSLEYLAMVIIGGAGTALGPVLGASAVQWLFTVSGSAGRYELLIYGLAFFFVVLFAPSGLAGLLQRPWNSLFDRLGKSAVGARRSSATLNKTAAECPTPGGAGKKAGLCLEVKSASKHFGGLVAVDRVDVDVEFGEIVALIGPNGAGKSTLFNLISGIERLTGGSIALEGRTLHTMSIHDRAAAIGRSFQVPRLVPELTVLQNVAARLDHLPGRRSEPEKLALAERQLADFGLSDLAQTPVHQVGLGYHKLIDIARSSIGAPSLLLLDEPAVGLTGAEVEHLGRMLVLLKNQGAAILVVEHNIGFVTTIADRIVVMEGGKRIAVGTAATVMEDPLVQDAYFGALT